MKYDLFVPARRSVAALGLLAAAAAGSMASSSAMAQAVSGTYTSTNGSDFAASGNVVTLNQNASSNAVAVVQQELVSDTVVTQSGFYNRSVVFQRGVNPATFNDKFANVTQAGDFNRSLIVQIGTTSADIQSAKTKQTGVAANNYNLAIQTSATSASNSDVASKLGALSVGDARAFATNFIFAPETARANVGVLEDITLHFSSILESQLDLNHRNACEGTEAGGKCPSWPVYLLLNYGEASREDSLGALGYKQNIRSATLGANVYTSQTGKFGIAVNFADTHSNLRAGMGGIDTTAYQFGAYGSLFGPNYFVDMQISIGKFDLSAQRFDGTGRVTSKTNGWGYAGRIQAGYLLGSGALRYGPVISASYQRNSVDGYSEAGSVLFTQDIGQQKKRAIYGSIGGIFEYGSASSVHAYLKAEVEHDFGIDDTRFVKTGFGFAPTRAVYTPLNSNVKDTYGKVSGSVSYPLGDRINLSLTGRTTFASSQVDSFSVFAGLRVKL